jgi:serine phosphatase RsbU (regulator of sigma subunit)
VWTPAILATAAGAAVFVLGTTAESVIVRAVHGNRRELEWLSDAVISMAVAGITYLWLHLKGSRSRVLALEQEQIAVDEQLRLAAEIQRGLLPDVPQATPGFRWAARMVPASRIGGDFYDFFQPAAGTVLAILGFETAPGRLAYVNAGHPAGYLLRNGKVTAALESGGRPLGLLPDPEYTTASVELSPGDVGVLVTDGITEALEAGPTTLPQILAASAERPAAARSPAAFCDDLLRAAAAGAGPAGVADWQDDRTVLVFTVEPST